MDSAMERLEALERGMSELKVAKKVADGRLRLWRGAVCSLAGMVMLLLSLQSGRAAGSGASPSLVRRVRDLEAILWGPAGTPVGERTFIRSGDDIIIRGANLHVQNGTGATGGVVNGLGNLIVGYNEVGRSEGKHGSHNVVIGPGHSYPSYGGLVAGHSNALVGPHASATGGFLNTILGDFGHVSGGFSNTTHGSYSTVGGGAGNSTGLSNTDGNPTTAGAFAHVCGGENNAAQAEKSSILGGFGRQINVVQGTRFLGAPGGD